MGLLLQQRPGGPAVPIGLAVLASIAVGVTVVSAVPAHTRLGDGFRGEDLQVLLGANLIRTLAWTASAGVSAAVPGGSA